MIVDHWFYIEVEKKKISPERSGGFFLLLKYETIILLDMICIFFLFSVMNDICREISYIATGMREFWKESSGGLCPTQIYI